MKLFTYHAIIEALLASGSQPSKNSKSNQPSQVYLQSDCTSQTDVPTFVLMASSEASHLFPQNPILKTTEYIYFWINSDLPTRGCNSDL